MHSSQRQPAHTGPFSQPCLSALDGRKKPDLKAMVNQIFTIQLRAQLKLSALLEPMFSCGKITPRSPQNGVKGKEHLQRKGNGSLLNPLGSQLKEAGILRRHLLLPTSNKPNWQDRQQWAARLKRKQHQGLHIPAHFSAPLLKWEHQLNPPPRHLAGVNHLHSPSPGWMMWGLAARDHWVSAISGSVAFSGCWHLSVAQALRAAVLAP